jgi:Domain of unknown function (DUF4258)
MQGNVVPFSEGLSRAAAQELIRRLVADSKFAWDGHFAESMLERQIVMRQVLTALLEGQVVQGPDIDEYGDWRCKVEKWSTGQRVTVIVAITRSRDLLKGVTTY